VGQDLEEQEVEPHLVEVPQTQMLRTLEMPLTQPYVKQGLGLLLAEDLEDQEAPVVPEDLEDLEDLEEYCLCQSWLHTWFQSQQTPMCTLWAPHRKSSIETDNKQMHS